MEHTVSGSSCSHCSAASMLTSSYPQNWEGEKVEAEKYSEMESTYGNLVNYSTVSCMIYT